MYKYLHHISDFMVDTAHLTALEECFYRRAIDFYYLNEKPLPKETQSVFRRLRAITQDEQQAVLNVLEDFFVEQEDGFHNKRADAEIAEYQQNSEKNRENGKKGGRPSKNKPSENSQETKLDNENKPKETQSVILGYEMETQTKGNQQPTTNNQQPIINTHTLSENENSKIEIAATENWQPNSEILLNVIKTSVGAQAEQVLAMPDYEFHLGKFNAHWEDKIELSESQKTYRFATWIINEFKKSQAKPQHFKNSRQPEKPKVNRNVNDAHGDMPYYAPAIDDVDVGEML